MLDYKIIIRYLALNLIHLSPALLLAIVKMVIDQVFLLFPSTIWCIVYNVYSCYVLYVFILFSVRSIHSLFDFTLRHVMDSPNVHGTKVQLRLCQPWKWAGVYGQLFKSSTSCLFLLRYQILTLFEWTNWCIVSTFDCKCDFHFLECIPLLPNEQENDSQ